MCVIHIPFRAHVSMHPGKSRIQLGQRDAGQVGALILQSADKRVEVC